MSNCVFVIDQNKNPLRPIGPGLDRRLLKAGQAAVYRTYPYTIICGPGVSTGYPEDLWLVVTPKGKVTDFKLVRRREVIWRAVLEHRSAQIRKRIEHRAMIRRSRRGRKTRYRPPRFDNRTRRAGWYPPSIMHRVETTLTWIGKLQALCGVQDIEIGEKKFLIPDDQKWPNLKLQRAQVRNKLGMMLFGDQKGHRGGYRFRDAESKTGPVSPTTDGSVSPTQTSQRVPPTPAKNVSPTRTGAVSSTPSLVSRTRAVLHIKAVGHGNRQVVLMDKYGFPRSGARGAKRVHGFSLGDHVTAEIPSGKHAGRYRGVIAGVRMTGQFALRAGDVRISSVNWKYLKLVQRADGYAYEIKMR